MISLCHTDYNKGQNIDFLPQVYYFLPQLPLIFLKFCIFRSPNPLPPCFLEEKTKRT